jgi:hypothetical protein
MRYLALATDYDGTLAHDGRVSDEALGALQRARRAGFKMLLVTGRELSDLFNIFPHVDTFDRIVAENGAVVFNTSTKAVRVLANAPPPEFIERLERANVPLSVGHSIVATVDAHLDAVLAAISDLGMDWHVSFNKGSVMALPVGVTKRTIGVGDAENDHAFLRVCGLAVAVANALPLLKREADLVTAGTNGVGVAELIEDLLSGRLDAVVPRSRGTYGTSTKGP